MKVIISRPSLPLLLVAILLGIPVSKAPARPRPQQESTRDEHTAEPRAQIGYDGVP
jgi:hypothetical protein